jgi:hypothetical protein
MMVALLDAAQIERIVGLVADQKSQAIDVEGARAGKVAHTELDVAGPHHIERRVENWFPNWHLIGRR